MEEKIQITTTKQKVLYLLQKTVDRLEQIGSEPEDAIDDIRTAIAWLKENE
jgi:hypothetical protein